MGMVENAQKLKEHAQMKQAEQASKEQAIFHAGAQQGLAQAAQVPGPSNLMADTAQPVPQEVNVTNEEIAMLQAMGLENPTMEDVNFLRKQASLEALQGGLGAPADSNTSGLAGMQMQQGM